MVQQKAKPLTKRVTAAKTRSRPKATKAAVVTIAKKPAVKKPAAKKPATKKPIVKKATIPAKEIKTSSIKTANAMAKPAANQITVAKPTPEERYRMVEVAAYFIAEQHGFKGRTDEYWAAAEREIVGKLNL